MVKAVGFGYGALCDSLEKQANEQGFTLGEKSKLFEKLRFSLNMVTIHGLVTDSQANKAFEKLNNQVVKSLIPITDPTKEDT